MPHTAIGELPPASVPTTLRLRDYKELMQGTHVFIELGLGTATDEGVIEDLLRGVDWNEPVDEIRVVRKFSKGFSGCDVLEIELGRGGHSHLVVAKIGPADELRKECEAYTKAYKDGVIRGIRVFTPVRAGSRSVMGEGAPRPGALGVLVYDHVEEVLIGHSRSFEELAGVAVSEGGEALQIVLAVLDDLMMGGLKVLYRNPETISTGSNWSLWNEWLGTDAIVEVDSWNSKAGRFVHSEFAAYGTRGAINTTANLRKAVTRPYVEALGGVAFEMELEREWWGERLFGRPPDPKLLVQIDCKDSDSLDAFRMESERKEFGVQGVIRSLRTSEQRSRLLSKLGGVINIENSVVVEENAHAGATLAADPFPPLLQILDQRAKGFTSLVHGDLHGENILVVQTRQKANLPCVIDYRWLGCGRPFLFDFVKLETTLTRNALPSETKKEKEFSWAQAIYLQRLLALATRLGGSADDEIRKMLSRLDQRLANAFSLIIAIRNHARAIHPQGESPDWHLIYAESLFLSAHSTFHWPNRTKWENIASLAVAGVAAEWLNPQRRYRWWSKKDLVHTVKRISKPLISIAGLDEISAIDRVIDTERWRLPSVEAVLDRAVKADLKKHYRDVIFELLALRSQAHGFYMRVPAVMKIKGRVDGGKKRDVLEILDEHRALVVLGDMGSGKTTITQVWQYKLAKDLYEKGDSGGRLPLVIWAPLAKDVPAEISTEACLNVLKEAVRSQTELTEQEALRKKLISGSVDWEDLLIAGAVHITIDGLNEVEESRKGDIIRWILGLRQYFPRSPVVVCHRLYNYSPDLLPFPVVELQRVEDDEVRSYIRTRFKAIAPSDGESLIKLLLPEKAIAESDRRRMEDLIQTPFLLYMIVERCLKNPHGVERLLKGRGELLSGFAELWLSGEYRQARTEQSFECRYSVEEKKAFLNLIGDFLVSGKTRFISRRIVERLAAKNGVRDCLQILGEIVDVGMLLRSPDGYSFQFQSFEEYFAAVHFFNGQPDDPDALSELVKTYAWHDTLVMLVGYGDLNEKRLDVLVDWSRIVDPVLTARILRVAEYKDRPRQGKFLKSQMEVLRLPDAGRHLWAKATEAIAVLDSEESVECLMEIAGDSDAPPGSRAEALRRLSLLPPAGLK